MNSRISEIGFFLLVAKVQNVEDEAHYYDYHIIYSASYMVPMLYFRGYSSGMSHHHPLQISGITLFV